MTPISTMTAVPMKIIVDALGAPADSGGMRLYAQEIIRSWKDTENDDTLIVVGGAWIREDFRDLDYVIIREVASGHFVGRSLGHLLVVANTYWWNHADAVLSTTPIVPGHARHCVVHDWRHVKNPGEFSALRRLYRQLWRASVSWAGQVSAISEKTLSETLDPVPGAHASLVENGRDHPRRWSIDRSAADSGGERRILTFGHHSNKRPQLVIEAASLIASDLRIASKIIVLGARGEFAAELTECARRLGLAKHLEVPGFVDARVYEHVIASASVIVMVSTDEGFGLPIAEAQYFGIPAVATADSGLGAIHGHGLTTADPTPEALACAIEEALRLGVVRGSRTHIRSWGSVAQELRQKITCPSDSGSDSTTSRFCLRKARNA
jgi:glycosyltransferase involved in cell wall biosynthesis